MFELEPADFHKVFPIFRQIDHNIAIVFSVIEGNTPGRVFVDNHQSPTSALLYPQGAFFYVAGDANDFAFGKSVKDLLFHILLPKAEEKELVLFSFSDAWKKSLDALLGDTGAIQIHRKDFSFNLELFSARRGWRDKIPSGFSLRAVDQQIAAEHPLYQSLLSASSKRFGFCLMKGAEIVSACTTNFIGGGEAEIDIHTIEAYQGRGFAALTASALIEACISKGLTPHWSCWPERMASRALALKLGFEERPDIPAHYWAADL